MDELKTKETGNNNEIKPAVDPGMTNNEIVQSTNPASSQVDIQPQPQPQSQVSSEMATEEVANASEKKSWPIKQYVMALVAVLVIGVGLVYVMEKEGRISTTFFTKMISAREAAKPVAKVNDTKILKSDFDSSIKQLEQMATMQGADISTLQEQFKTQALDTLVNGELLRQAAMAAGITADEAGVETRFQEIAQGVGGQEALNAKMAEFNITEVSLRRDIENELLIQDLFDKELDLDSITVTDKEIKDFYEQAGGAAANLPPLEEVKADVEKKLKADKEQLIINDYIESLRSEAEVEILI